MTLEKSRRLLEVLEAVAWRGPVYMNETIVDATTPFGRPEDWSAAPSGVTDFFAYAEKMGWGDGLPLVPPTAAAIMALLDSAGVKPDDDFGIMPPAEGVATAAKVAANAVMAGSTPQTFPIVLAAIQALLHPKFNLNGVQSTTHPVAPLVVVHGPVVENAGFNAQAGTFGPGFRANATVGRAVRLCLLNIGGARPGERDRATQGQPSKYTYCIAENVAESPWLPYTVEQAGLSPTDSAVTVFGGENPHNVNDHVSNDAVGILSTVASNVAVLGANNAYYSAGEFFIILCPEHAATIAGSGFDRHDVQMWLYEKARMTLRTFKRGGMWGMQAWPDWKESETDGDARLPLVDTPDKYRIMVAGGPGKHSSVLPSFGITQSVTQRIAITNG